MIYVVNVIMCILPHTQNPPWIPELTFLLRILGRILSSAWQGCYSLGGWKKHRWLCPSHLHQPWHYPGPLWANVRDLQNVRMLDLSLRNRFPTGTRTYLTETTREICHQWPPSLSKCHLHTQESCFTVMEGTCTLPCSCHGAAAVHVNCVIINESVYCAPGCMPSGGRWQVLAVEADVEAGTRGYRLATDWSLVENGNLERKLVANSSPATGLLIIMPVWHSPNEVQFIPHHQISVMLGIMVPISHKTIVWVTCRPVRNMQDGTH